MSFASNKFWNLLNFSTGCPDFQKEFKNESDKSETKNTFKLHKLDKEMEKKEEHASGFESVDIFSEFSFEENINFKLFKKHMAIFNSSDLLNQSLANHKLPLHHFQQTKLLQNVSHINIVKENLQFIYSFFIDLNLQSMKITVIDEDMLKFKNLKSLNLDGNFISEIKGSLICSKIERIQMNANL